MREEQLKKIIKERFSKKRAEHILGVVKVARKLAKHWGADEEAVSLAAYLHDYGKVFKGKEMLAQAEKFGLVTDEIYRQFPELLHAKLGAELARVDLGIVDERVLSAISAHCYGSLNMTLEDKIIFIADYIEPARSFEGVEEVREMAFSDLDRTMLMAIDGTMQYVIRRGLPIHVTSIHLRNRLLKELSEG